ncbi:4-oxalocrotonate tautomerase family protein [Rhodococcoides fascians]|uniref:4-oxalocrotonate tautomerase family protein n=1 Tax=Rhodococcoides fascians TaxID=1828 RepID=UPI00378B9275
MLGKERNMAFIDVTIARGCTPEVLRDLISNLTEAAVQSTGSAEGNVRVVIREVETTHWAAGNITIAERRSAVNEGSKSTI